MIAFRFIKELFGSRDIGEEGQTEQEYHEENKIDVEQDLKLFDDLQCVIDIWHNYLEIGEKQVPVNPKIDTQNEINYDTPLEAKNVVIHRKGATPSDKGYVVIPGNRGSYSYLVKPLEDNGWLSGYSLAHGAGRKMSRSKALANGKHHYENPKTLLKTDLDSRVV